MTDCCFANSHIAYERIRIYSIENNHSKLFTNQQQLILHEEEPFFYRLFEIKQEIL